MNNLETALILMVVIEALIIAILAWKNASMIPPEVVGMLFGFAERKAAETPETWDDKAIADLQTLWFRLKQDNSTLETQADVKAAVKNAVS